MADSTQNQYLRDAVMTASPEQLQLMLYDGAIRFSLQAREAIEERDFETSYDRLSRAQRIMLEMQQGLNFDVNPELCGRVASLYNFIRRKLADACTQRDVASIDDALKILRMERETWQILIDKIMKIEPDGGGDEHISPVESSDATTPASFSVEA